MIRRARPSDAGAIARIWNRVIRDTTITFTDVEKSTRDVAALIETAPVFVGEHNGVAGFCTYGPFRSGPGYRFVAEHSVHLDPAAHRMKLGTALMDRLEAHALAEGIDTMIAGMTADNQPSIQFHQARGYNRVALLPEVGEKFGQRHDLVLLQKKLHLSH